MTTDSRPSALSGLRVVDFSNSIAGIQASQHLADNGAEVVHVEPPGGSPYRDHKSWPLWGRGKQSVVLNLRVAGDRARARELACNADVVIETFRPGVAERLALDYESLSAEAPQLVYGSVTGFGRSGPYAGIKAYEGVVMAKMGAMQSFRAAYPRPGPVFPSVWMASMSATQVLLHGLLAALYERERSGRGQRVDTTLVQALASQDLNNMMHLVLARRWPGAFNVGPFLSEDGTPNSGMVFRTLVALTRDGRWLQFGQLSQRLFEAFMVSLELEWMFEDPAWKTAPEFDDPSRRLEFWDRMLVAARKKSLAEWQGVFDTDPHVWAEMYRRGAELLDHPQMLHDGRVVEVAAPAAGRVRQPGLLVHLDATPGNALRGAPALGSNSLGASERTNKHPINKHPIDSQPIDSQPIDTGPPLAGVTILELGMYFAGPLGATMLADLGARVIKIEPHDGDPGRSFTGFPEAGGTRTMQGKESVAVDLATPEGREIAHRLVPRVDVVLQSYRPGVAHRLGLDAATLRALNPELIYVEAPGYGVDGPCASRSAFAPTIGAASGFALRNVGRSVPERADLDLGEIKKYAAQLFPATIVVGHADAFAAHAVATAILLGLVARARHGHGQTLATSMLSSMAHVLSDQMVVHDGPGDPTPEADAELYGNGALYRLYRAASGWVFLAAPDAKDWAPLATTVLGASVLDDRRFATPELRRTNDAALAGALAAAFVNRSATEWERLLLAVDVAGVEVSESTIETVLLDGGLGADTDFVTNVLHPTWDEHPRLSPVVRLSRSTTVAPPGSLCGQHTIPILTELGFAEAHIRELHDRMIVR